MREWLNQNPVTAMLYVVFLLVAVIGGVVILTDGEGSFTFEDYTNRLVVFAGAIGLFGAGKAVKNGLLQKEQTGGGLPGSTPADDEDDFVEYEFVEDEYPDVVPGLDTEGHPGAAPLEPDMPEGAVGGVGEQPEKGV